MPCNCHGRKGETIEGRVPPDSPCTVCALKHLNMALTAWGEFSYEEDNRLYVAGHLRLAMEHLKQEHRDVALDIRSCAILVELARDAGRDEVNHRLKSLLCEVNELMHADHPEIRARLSYLKDGSTKAAQKAKYIFRTHRHLGDAVILTGALHNLSLAYPNLGWIYDPKGHGHELYEKNPDMARGGLEDQVTELEICYGGSEKLGNAGSMVEAFTKDLATKLKLDIPVVTSIPFLPDVTPPKTHRQYIIISPNVQTCSQAKAWSHWQEFVDLFRGFDENHMEIIQVGGNESRDISVTLQGVTDMRGKTTPEELCALVKGAYCTVSAPTSIVNIAAAYGVRSYVIVGCRESVFLSAYPTVTAFTAHTCGYDGKNACMAFATNTGSRNPCRAFVIRKDGKVGVPHCMDEIQPSTIVNAILGTPQPLDMPKTYGIIGDNTGGVNVIQTIVNPDKVDVIIPLGKGSQSGDDELKIALRSLETYAGKVGRVYLATHYPPAWLNRNAVTIVDIDDAEHHNKDANLIYKTMETISRYGITHFAWMADDNVFLKPIDLYDIPVLENHRTYENFTGTGIWHRRIRHTYEYFRSRGIYLQHNFESHAPQYFDCAQGLMNAMADVDFRTQPGLTIMTAFRCALRHTTAHHEFQENWKETAESSDISGIKFDRQFISYNDDAFLSGLREKLFKLFPNKSKYER